MVDRSIKLLALGLVVAFVGCESSPENATAPTFVGRVDTILSTQCLRCHAGPASPAGFRVDSWAGVMGCSPEDPAKVFAASPLLRALDRPDHASLVTTADRAVLEAWVGAGAPRSPGNTHGVGFADPRSSSSHGRFLRARTWRPMLDPNDPDACGTCHDGADRSRRPTITRAAESAPACTSCHVEPGGPFACTTCHGVMGGRSYPPRDRCFYPDAAASTDSRTHAAHVEPSPTHADAIACTTCHANAIPLLGEIANDRGTHGNGFVDVRFDHAVAGRAAAISGGDKRCTGTCHDRGGLKPTPTWTTPSTTSTTTCNDCHSSPPANHYGGACTSCHREANATGTALSAARLHINGKVDLGDGSGKCGACHGAGDDPWPNTGAHAAHANPKSSAKVACTTCHDVPADLTMHPTGKSAATVKLQGLAVRGGRRATYDATTKTCAGTYCHEGRAGARTTPSWTDPISSGATASCSACHASPPPTPHPPSTACGSCHPTTAPEIFTLHVDGRVDNR